MKVLFEKLELFDSLVFHKKIAKVQQTAYKMCLKVEHLKNKILIELDFKQKIKIGLSPRQVSSEYYDQVERLCLGLFKLIKVYLSKTLSFYHFISRFWCVLCKQSKSD